VRTCVDEDDATLCRILQSLDIAVKVEVDSLGVVVRVGNRSQADIADNSVVVGWSSVGVVSVSVDNKNRGLKVQHIHPMLDWKCTSHARP
jgi:hypothetical protein